ncbi:MAG: hypothetical protein GX545_08815, partial [Fibrobacter sp.]|nr:hypothetical protein [Fibrobacter sp.]
MRNYAILLCCFFTGLLSAQNLQVITGEVTDAMGEPLIGVSVLVKETSSGTITDMEGKFTVSADIGHTLQFSYVGYTTQNLVIASTAPLKVILTEDTQRLEELVVVGYGTQKKVNLTGSVDQALLDETINDVRDRVKLPGYSKAELSSQEAVREAVRKERR